MSDRLMTAEDLANATGCLTANAQIYWFKKNGIEPTVSGRGELILTKATWSLIQEQKTLCFDVIPSVENALTPRAVQREKSAIYFLMDKNDVVYVGKSTNLVRRIADHERSSMHWDSAVHIHAEAEDLDMLEMEFIARLKPRYNKMGMPKEIEK